MEEVFIEYLDQIYWEGYGEEFRSENQIIYGIQLAEFTENHNLPI